MLNCVHVSGVFNSAEAWRQYHVGHDAEGKTAAVGQTAAAHKLFVKQACLCLYL